MQSLCFWRNWFYRGKWGQALSHAQSKSDNGWVQSRFGSGSVLGDVVFHRGCGDGKINGLCQRSLPLKWEYHAACSIEALCSCLWMVPSCCLGRELHICISGLWFLSAGTGCLLLPRCQHGLGPGSVGTGLWPSLLQPFARSRASFKVKSGGLRGTARWFLLLGENPHVHVGIPRLDKSLIA